MNTPAIYKIHFGALTSDCYVGKAKNPVTRLAGHLRFLREGRHHSPKLQAAFVLHGESAMQFEILERCNRNQLSSRERHWMIVLSPALNIVTANFPCSELCVQCNSRHRLRGKEICSQCQQKNSYEIRLAELRKKEPDKRHTYTQGCVLCGKAKVSGFCYCYDHLREKRKEMEDAGYLRRSGRRVATDREEELWANAYRGRHR